MSVHLITGKAGKDHVTAEDIASFNAALFGSESVVLNIGKKFNASIITNNLIRIYDGDALMQGRHIRINTNTYEDVTIESGTQTRYRKDLICLRYVKNAEGIESASIVVLKGTEATTASGATIPTYTSGDILAGDLVADFPLYTVTLSGINITALKSMFNVLNLVDDMFEIFGGANSLKQQINTLETDMATIEQSLVKEMQAIVPKVFKTTVTIEKTSSTTYGFGTSIITPCFESENTCVLAAYVEADSDIQFHTDVSKWVRFKDDYVDIVCESGFTASSLNKQKNLTLVICAKDVKRLLQNMYKNNNLY